MTTLLPLSLMTTGVGAVMIRLGLGEFCSSPASSSGTRNRANAA